MATYASKLVGYNFCTLYYALAWLSCLKLDMLASFIVVVVCHSLKSNCKPFFQVLNRLAPKPEHV